MMPRLIPLLALLAPAVAAAEPACVQADAHARTAKIDSSFSVSGAGGTRLADGTRMLVWTGIDCIAWVQFRGPLVVNADWQSFAPSVGARFVAHDESAAGRRDFTLSADGQASFTIDGRLAAMSADDRAWLGAMILEYVRRAGVSVQPRAMEIAGRSGVSGLLEETRRVSSTAIRARYLIAGFQFVDSTSRAAFIRDGTRLLGNAGDAAEFLLAVPRSWRTDERVIVATFTGAARIEPDEYVEQILRSFAPPRPTPAVLRPLIAEMIATLQNTERRAALRGYYLDVAP